MGNGATAASETYQHDAHGNMLRMPHLGGGLPGPNMHWDYTDQLRQGNYDRCEALLRHMDDIYALLITIDYPDAITGGLRHTTDAARGILEKTRGDLTVAVSQAQLQQTQAQIGNTQANYEYRLALAVLNFQIANF